MPSRFAFYSPAEVVEERFGISTKGIEFYEYYNLKPTNRTTGLINIGGKKLVRMRWGLARGNMKHFKARAEEAHDKRSFGKGIRERRSLIFANGFFEWDKKDKRSIPHYFTLKNEELFCIAGIYDRFENDEGGIEYTTAVLTVEANELVGEVFHRMPLIISKEDEEIWLDPSADEEVIKSLVKPYPQDQMASWKVDPLPSRGDNGPDTIKPISEKNTSLEDFF